MSFNTFRSTAQGRRLASCSIVSCPLRYYVRRGFCVAQSCAVTQPEQGELHVWWLRTDKVLNQGALLRSYEGLLCPEELDYVHSAKCASAQKERLMSRAVLRSVLSKYMGGLANPSSLCIAKNLYGKPYLDCSNFAGLSDFPDIQFNVAHTAGLIGCAVSSGVPVGLDVECMARVPTDLMRVARRKFSSAEQKLLLGAPTLESQRRRFLQLWTLKEAYVKAKGTGINKSEGLSTFSFDFAEYTGTGSLPQGITCTKSNSSIIPCGFLSFQPFGEYIAALCADLGPCNSTGEFCVRTWETVPLVSDEPLSNSCMPVVASSHHWSFDFALVG